MMSSSRRQRGDHALPLHAEAIDTVQGCNREGIGPNEWQSAPRRDNTDWQKLAGHVGTDSGAVSWLKMEGPNDRALLDDLGDSEGTSSRRQRRSFLATLDLRPTACQKRVWRLALWRSGPAER